MSSFSIFNQPQPPIKNAVPTPASSSSFALNSSQQQVNAPQNGCPSDQRQMTNYDVIGVLGEFLTDAGNNSRRRKGRTERDDPAFGRDNRAHGDFRKFLVKKYVPTTKTEAELFSEESQIPVGHQFSRQFGEQMDGKISIDGGAPEQRIPNIIRSFDECGFQSETLQNLERLNYRIPLQIQKAVIPLILHTKNDILAHAPTGSGKTASFLLPIIKCIADEKKRTGVNIIPSTPFALILSPTKELAMQLAEDAQKFARGTPVSVSYGYGDLAWAESRHQLTKGCDILISTNGRAYNYIKDKEVHLHKLMFFVLDEADKLLASDAGALEIVRKIKETLEMKSSSRSRMYRTLLFSATIDQSLLDHTKDVLQLHYFRVRIGELNTTAWNIKQEFIQTQTYDKLDVLVDFLLKRSNKSMNVNGEIQYRVPKTIVFINEKRRCDWLAISLALRDFLVMSINSMHTLEERHRAVQKFTAGGYDILVGTDVIGRGLNFPYVDYVINFDLPLKHNPNVYIHRIGRTGRIGNEGRAVSLFNTLSSDDIELMDFYVNQLEVAKQPVPLWMRDPDDNRDNSTAPTYDLVPFDFNSGESDEDECGSDEKEEDFGGYNDNNLPEASRRCSSIDSAEPGRVTTDNVFEADDEYEDDLFD